MVDLGSIAMNIKRDVVSMYRKLREIQTECSLHQIGVRELARREGCRFNIDSNEDGKDGNAIHFLIGKDDINDVEPDCDDCEIVTYRSNSDNLISIRSFKVSDIIGGFGQSCQYAAMKRSVYIELKPFGNDFIVDIDSMCSMDISNKDCRIFAEAKRCWEFARDKIIKDEADIAARRAQRGYILHGREISSEMSHPFFSNGVVIRRVTNVTPQNMMFVLDRKSQSHNFLPLFRMKRKYLRTIKHFEYNRNNKQAVNFI